MPPRYAVPVLLLACARQGDAVRRDYARADEELKGCPTAVYPVMIQGRCRDPVTMYVLNMGCCTAFREADPQGAPSLPDIDYHFMTNDFKYASPKAGLWSKFVSWFGKRQRNKNVKEEVVTGHYCQRRGTREQTYYASSFAYWLPEIPSRSRSPTSSPLTWRKNQGTSALCETPLTATGKCVKCSVCHNGGHGQYGAVTRSEFIEEVEVSATCLKELDIEAECVARYHLNSGALKAENDRCLAVQTEYDTASAAYTECQQELRKLPARIGALPGEIRQARANLERCEDRLRNARNDEWLLRSQASLECERYNRLSGMNMYSYDSGFGLGMPGQTAMPTNYQPLHCVRPVEPFGEQVTVVERMTYDRDLDRYLSCQRCDVAHSRVNQVSTRVQAAQGELNAAEQRLPALESELEQSKQSLAEWQGREPALKSTLQAAEQSWLPQRDACAQTFADYRNGKATFLSACAPTFYNVSCEKECVEGSGLHEVGAGVMEGPQPNGPEGLGWPQVSCAPPASSWVMTPLGTGTAASREAIKEQCQRITMFQRPRYAQTTVKTGWLWKKGTAPGWDKRFFILESATQVRSAQLRYWEEDPAMVDTQESYSKNIILWDALKVVPHSGWEMGFKDGSQCFVLDHFYRDYKFCVPGDIKEDALSARDDWVEVLRAALVFPSPPSP